MTMTEEEKRKAYPQTEFKWYEWVGMLAVIWFIILSMLGVMCARWSP